GVEKLLDRAGVGDHRLLQPVGGARGRHVQLARGGLHQDRLVLADSDLLHAVARGFKDGQQQMSQPGGDLFQQQDLERVKGHRLLHGLRLRYTVCPSPGEYEWMSPFDASSGPLPSRGPLRPMAGSLLAFRQRRQAIFVLDAAAVGAAAVEDFPALRARDLDVAVVVQELFVEIDLFTAARTLRPDDRVVQLLVLVVKKLLAVHLFLEVVEVRVDGLDVGGEVPLGRLQLRQAVGQLVADREQVVPHRPGRRSRRDGVGSLDEAPKVGDALFHFHLHALPSCAASALKTCPPAPGGMQRADHTRDRYSLVRVSMRTLSPCSTKSGTCTTSPVSRVAGLVAPVAVSPLKPGSVWVTSSSTKVGSSTPMALSLWNCTWIIMLSLRKKTASPKRSRLSEICSYVEVSMKKYSSPEL